MWLYQTVLLSYILIAMEEYDTLFRVDSIDIRKQIVHVKKSIGGRFRRQIS